ncbi:hypothetical protein SBA4_2110005 [Candidatus Sulfopaludibacter sp. SbA4]|nr:hypothetical protein SBA4_2110005 [Candidatus Sulfopaludibacter sp. SbA4]
MNGSKGLIAGTADRIRWTEPRAGLAGELLYGVLIRIDRKCFVDRKVVVLQMVASPLGRGTEP